MRRFGCVPPAPALFVLFCILSGCGGYDSKLLTHEPAHHVEPDAATPDVAMHADRDAAADAGCGAACAEECNGRDDDGDGRVDEGTAAQLCGLANADATCLSGECLVVRCSPGYGDCDGDAHSGCEVELGTLTGCSGCGDDCGQLAHTKRASCSAESQCRIEQCASGFVDCDDDPSNGCEASFSDVLNCGGCASKGDAERCTELPGVLTASCASKTCKVTTCLPDFADCNGKAADGCERKVSVDGCCPGELDSDGDTVLDCLDGCKDDPKKSAPGACGCGVTDADMDKDGIADCRTDCWGFPSNFDPFDKALAFTVDATLTCSPTIDTSQPVASMISGWCNGDAPVPAVRAQPDGPMLVVVPLRGLTLAAGQKLRLVGDKPVLLAIEGDARIEGTIDAGSNHHTLAGAGGGAACSSGNGHVGAAASNDGASGGGGGSLTTAGGRGGSSNDGPGGVAGAVESPSTLVPLRAGCSGGVGGSDGGSGGGGGGFGGGALQVSATGHLVVAGTGVISTSGGGGARGTGRRDAGGGGGSGGAILLEANMIEVAQGAWITANGGSGAAGNESLNVCSKADGRDGNATSATPTAGGAGCNNSGDGGSGATASGAATNGSGARLNDAGGGGGGGRGLIVMQPLAGSLCAM